MSEPCCSVGEVSERVAHIEGQLVGIQGQLQLIIDLGGLKPEPRPRQVGAAGGALVGAAGAGVGFGIIEGVRRWLTT